MASATTNSAKPHDAGSPLGSRHDRRLAQILQHATGVFCEKGYAAASMRDLSRATGMSLAGLYYYFESKEKLLYLIQKHTFETIIDRLQERLQGISDPEQRIREFIGNHLEYFLANQQGMKVLAHETGILGAEREEEIRAIRREYYSLARGLIEALAAERKIEVATRLAVLSLFGMMNWIYTWHNPDADGDARELARHMGDLFLSGLLNGAKPKREAGVRLRRPAAAARKRRRASSSR